MPKFKINVDVDYVDGYLRYGHKEMIIEANNLEEAKRYLDSEENKEFFEEASDLIVDDYEVNDYGDLDYSNARIKEVNNE